MKLREIAIRNFRCLVDVSIPIADTTVFVGENNSGKTAVMDALRLVLSSSPSARGNPFDEYDYHMVKADDTPETCDGIVVELWFREDRSGEWPKELIQALNEVTALDAVNDINSIGLRVTSKYDQKDAAFHAVWEFLTLDGQPLGGQGANPRNVGRLQSYIRLIYLSALRDASEAFSSRSPYWGRLLKDLKITDKEKKRIRDQLHRINNALLKADPRLDRVVASLDKVQDVLATKTGKHTSVQALPLNLWDLMSKAQIMVKGRGSETGFPLWRHGQGMQSLAVLFLVQAYLEVLLKPSFEKETEAILAFEEPEAHLHPQATRALCTVIKNLPSQQLVSTHSPYFVQEIPFSNIRMFRREGAASRVLYIKQAFTAKLPSVPALTSFCATNVAKYAYQPATSILTVKGKLEETDYRSLLVMYPGRTEVQAELKRLSQESSIYLSTSDLSHLDTYAKRIRGEVLFARAWLLCEGQCEYVLMRYFAELLGTPLDRVGVTVIDYQNNGSPGAFVGLARAFEIPWIMLCDNDSAYKGFAREVEQRGVSPNEVNDLVRPLPEIGVNLELFLAKNGFESEYKSILQHKGYTISEKRGTAAYYDSIAKETKKDKMTCAIALIQELRTKGAKAKRVPPFFATAIKDILAKAQANG